MGEQALDERETARFYKERNAKARQVINNLTRRVEEQNELIEEMALALAKEMDR